MGQWPYRNPETHSTFPQTLSPVLVIGNIKQYVFSYKSYFSGAFRFAWATILSYFLLHAAVDFCSGKTQPFPITVLHSIFFIAYKNCLNLFNFKKILKQCL